jgi:hypothetical protein
MVTEVASHGATYSGWKNRKLALAAALTSTHSLGRDAPRAQEKMNGSSLAVAKKPTT